MPGEPGITVIVSLLRPASLRVRNRFSWTLGSSPFPGSQLTKTAFSRAAARAKSPGDAEMTEYTGMRPLVNRSVGPPRPQSVVNTYPAPAAFMALGNSSVARVHAPREPKYVRWRRYSI